MVRVLFIHPDLGIGGAERLVVDAALALKLRGHAVSFLTNHHDHSHCFKETVNGMLSVKVVGDWLPRHIFGKFSAVCAYLRMIYAAFYCVFQQIDQEQIDIIICDQISHCIPVLRLWSKRHPKILFYCHFPDQLLTEKNSLLKQLYRKPLDYLEERTIIQADRILVNSKFTRGLVQSTFTSLNTLPDVLYPSLLTNTFDESNCDEKEITVNIPQDKIVFLSINRYDRKKNLLLALKSFYKLKQFLNLMEWQRVTLIIAGGYDLRIEENIEYYDELKEYTAAKHLDDKVIYLRSPSDNYKIWLIKRATALLYTPANEHFGIVPLEAMYLRTPVIAVNNGGPTETVIHGVTGYLCNQTDSEFAKRMCIFIRDPSLKSRMGEQGRIHVQNSFSFKAFTDKLDSIVRRLSK